MILNDAIAKLKEHDIKYDSSLVAGKNIHILLKRHEGEPKISGMFKEADFDAIVPWIKDAAFKWYGIEIC